MREKQQTSVARLICLGLVTLLAGIGVTADEPAVRRQVTASSVDQAPAIAPELILVESDPTYNLAGGLRAYVDPQTGALVVPPAKDRALELSPALSRAFSTSDEGLVEVILPDGTAMVRLGGRFMSATFATVGEDGKVRVGHDLASLAAAEQVAEAEIREGSTIDEKP